MFSYVDLESRVRRDHPLRTVRGIVNDAVAGMSGDFEAIYAPGMGRPSIPPERLLRALLLKAFYGIRSERQIMERLEHDLLFRWFVGLGIDDATWDQTTFGKNRRRLRERTALDERRAARGGQGEPLGARRTHHAPRRLKVSQKLRERIAEVFDWTKSSAGLRQTRGIEASTASDGSSPSQWPPTT